MLINPLFTLGPVGISSPKVAVVIKIRMTRVVCKTLLVDCLFIRLLKLATLKYHSKFYSNVVII